VRGGDRRGGEGREGERRGDERGGRGGEGRRGEGGEVVGAWINWNFRKSAPGCLNVFLGESASPLPLI